MNNPLEPVLPTRDADGNIHFKVTSNGLTPLQWRSYLKNRGLRFSDKARDVIRYASGSPTEGIVYHVVIRLGKDVRSEDRVTEKIRAYAAKLGWKKPHWEVACLIRSVFTDEQMKENDLLSIVVMHEPIFDDDDEKLFLLASWCGSGGRLIDTESGIEKKGWFSSTGFAFVVPFPNS